MKPKPQRLTGRARDLAHGGEAAVETELGVVLVRGVLPGEEARVEVGEKRGGVRRGKLLELVGEPSRDRVEPPCPVAQQCGGCPLMMLSLEAQHAQKRRLVAQAVADVAVSGSPEVVMEVAGSDLGYRRRTRMAWARESGRAVVGYRAGGSRRVLPVSSCLVLTPLLSKVIPDLGRLLSGALAGEGEIELTPGPNGTVCVVFTTEADQPPTAYEACGRLAELDLVSGVGLRAGGLGALASWGTLQQHVPGVDGLPLIGPSEGFSQANEAVNARLVELVVELAEADGAQVLELYAGSGNLTVALAAKAKQVWAVEMDAELGRACQQNLAARGLSNVKVRVDPAEVGAKGGQVDCVVLDPPRTGARDALEGIVARKPQRVVYVSCDPMTLRRDAQQLAAAGYRVDRAHALDMFPHTAQVEAVVRFVRV